MGEILCGRCKKDNIKMKLVDGWVYTVGKREGVLMKITEEYKYKSIKRTADVLAELIDEVLPDRFYDKEVKEQTKLDRNISRDEVVIVPLPTIAKHIRERGFDHTLRLAKIFAKKRGYKCSFLLVRRNKTVQVGTDSTTRHKQAKNAYEAVSGVNKDRVYLLLDDVWTTGASMRAAREELRRAGAERIYGVTICRGLLEEK